MSVYENRFKKLLIEKDEEMSDDQTAMAQTLDKGTEVSDFMCKPQKRVRKLSQL